ncbi:MAG: polyphosphate kinase 2 family protein [Actinobacteria bacterium]|nr:polyphosphate kinase 2 family protein [Actinomycetota bacterium]
MSRDSLLADLRVAPGHGPGLLDRDPGERVGASSKKEGAARLAEVVERLGVLHNRLYAEASRSVLLVLQGMDASGKDGVIRSVFTGLNPQGCRVQSFKAPSPVELAHDFLWRVHQVCPARGEIVIFNRSHYEDIVAVRVRKLAEEKVWGKRYDHIRGFEKLLTDEGTTVVKVFLHVSRDEQRVRLQERLDDPEKRWKFRPGDLDDRALWDEFSVAYEDVLGETSTKAAPWYVVPADHNWSRNLAVAGILVAALEEIDPKLPEPVIEPTTIT